MNTSILDFGAVSSEAVSSTEAFRKAIEACAMSGGGVVEVPAGNWVSGTIELLDHVHLHLAPGATILGSMDIADYHGTRRGCAWGTAMVASGSIGATNMNECRALILADNRTDCGIFGEGTVNGRRGAAYACPPEAGRPFLLVFSECTFVKVSGLMLKHPGMFTFYGLNCADVMIDRVTIRTAESGNGDGLDFDGGKRVFISNCDIDAGDDGISLKTLTPGEPCEDFTITNCQIRSKHWGAVRIGPESAADIRRVTISNCVFYDCGDGLKVQLTQHSVFEDFLFSDILMHEVLRPFFFTVNRYNMSEHVKESRPPMGKLRRVRISGITGDVRQTSDFGSLIVHNGSIFASLPGFPMEDIVLEGIRLTVPGGGSSAEAERMTGHGEMYDFWSMYPEHMVVLGNYPAAALTVRHADGVRLRDCAFSAKVPDARAAVACECVRDLHLTDCRQTGCGNLLRAVDCGVPSLTDCRGGIQPIGAAALAEWSAFHQLSLSVDEAFEKLANGVDAARQLPVAALYADRSFTVTKTGNRQVLLISKISGDFTLTVNGQAADRRALPAPYGMPLPYVFDLTDILTAGENRIALTGEKVTVEGEIQLRETRQ